MTDTDDPDAWWASLDPDRRRSIFHWIARPDTIRGPIPGQLELITKEEDHGRTPDHDSTRVSRGA
ncbi:hypothetical protein [Corynebacterium doosanense]|uniref:hypothetical protein n=1 Tax=Corynebacterium doosanense TaxID=1121358 RepID=UPI00039F0345|nr:hypothetical protein [Corynebacterium doosanense]